MTVNDFRKALLDYPGDWNIVLEYKPDEQFNVMVIDLIDNNTFKYNKSMMGNYTVSDSLLKRMYVAVRPPK